MNQFEPVPRFRPPGVVGYILLLSSSTTLFPDGTARMSEFRAAVDPMVIVPELRNDVHPVIDEMSEFAPDAAAPICPRVTLCGFDVFEVCDDKVAALAAPMLLRAVVCVPESSERLFAVASAPTCAAVVLCGFDVESA